MAPSKPKPDGRKVILVCAAVAMVVSGLFPPWLVTLDSTGTRDDSGGHSEWSYGYALLLAPPSPDPVAEYLVQLFPHGRSTWGIRLDIARLMVEWVCILAASGAAWGVACLNREQLSDAKQLPKDGSA